MSDKVKQERLEKESGTVRMDLRVPCLFKKTIQEMADRDHRDLSKQVRYMLEQQILKQEVPHADESAA